jgi:hypothetical protein
MRALAQRSSQDQDFIRRLLAELVRFLLEDADTRTMSSGHAATEGNCLTGKHQPGFK